jgi:hypothetical protein
MFEHLLLLKNFIKMILLILSQRGMDFQSCFHNSNTVRFFLRVIQLSRHLLLTCLGYTPAAKDLYFVSSRLVLSKGGIFCLILDLFTTLIQNYSD